MSKWVEERTSEDYFQILQPDGSLNEEPPNLGDQELLHIYRTFIRTRTYDNKRKQLQRAGELSISSLSRGEEATPLGTAMALEPGDWVFPSYRQQAAFFYWGYDPARLIASQMGASDKAIEEQLGPPESSGVNFTPPYLLVSMNLTNAAGFAMIDAFDGNDTVSMAYVGDGGTSEGEFYEGLNFAGVFEAPLVTIIQNNQWAISVPSHRQTAAKTFAQKGEAVGIPHERIDGNDVFAVYQKTKEAVEKARSNEPRLLECVTYRLAEHNTADDPSDYRGEEEVKHWRQRDPLVRYEKYLKNTGVLTAEEIEDIKEDIGNEIDAAVRTARGMPTSEAPTKMFENHLHQEGWNHKLQRLELLAEAEGKNPFTEVDWRHLE